MGVAGRGEGPVRWPGGTLPLLRFEIRRRFGDPWVRTGFLLLTVLMGLEAWGRVQGLLVPGSEGGTGTLVFLVGIGLGLRLGHGTDREVGFTRYLGVNFVPPWGIVAARTAAVVLYLVLFWAYGVALSALLPGVSAGWTAWSGALVALPFLLFLPALAGIELLSAIRFPALVVVLLYVMGALVVVALTGDEEISLRLLGMAEVQRGVWSSLVPLEHRILVAIPVAVILAAGGEGRRVGRGIRGGRGRLSAP